MHITIVVPFQNTEQYIEDCIRALLAQNYPQGCYEIIMIDNNSTDRSVEIVSRYPEVTLLSEAIRYTPNMCVRHLEVTNVWKWFKKMHIYGRSLLEYRNLVQCRPLYGSERMEVLRATIRRGGYSMPKSLLSILLLSIGLLYYEFGCWVSKRNIAQQFSGRCSFNDKKIDDA